MWYVHPDVEVSRTADDPSSWLLQLIDRSPMLMVVSDPGTDRCLWVSPSVEALLGGNGGRGGACIDLAALLDPDQYVQLTEHWRQTLARGVAVPLSMCCRRRDGRMGTFEGSCFPVHTYGGRTLVGMAFVEVTELVAARGRAQHLLDHLPIVLTSADVTGNLLSVDGAGVRTPTGTRSIPSHVDELFPADCEARQSAERLRSAALAGQVARGRFRRAGRWWEAVSAPLTEAGEVTGVLTISTDIDEQVRAEAARKAAEAKFEVFMRHCPAPAVIKDGDGRVVWANRAWADGCDAPLEGLLGRALHDIIDPVSADAANEADTRVLTTSAPLRDVNSFRRHDGATVVHAGFRFPLHGPAGQALVGGVFLDVTEAANREAELRSWRDRYRTLFDRSPSAMLVIGPDGAVLDANPAFCYVVGIALTALRGRTAGSLTDDPDGAFTASQIHEAITSDAITHISVGLRDARRATLHQVRITLMRVNDTGPTPGSSPSATVVAVVQPTGASTADRAELAITAREADVLELRAGGSSNGQIASRLGLTRRGVDYHIAQLAHKLDASSAAIVARAYQLGILTTAAWPPAVDARHRAYEPQQRIS